MIPKRVSLILLAVCLMIGWTVGTASAAPPSEDMTTDAQILNPGSAGSCPNDFVVENPHNEAVELQLILGNEQIMQEKIEPNDAKAYGLQHRLAEAMMQGKNVNLDDWATVFNLGEKGSVNMFCLQ
ncbi:hypothetical protein [Nitrospina watsonii]|uniref:Uncharacterized protein n=1 Tax=Nitrospina watsonii TaxID=1323948 RepID=A0ABN8W3M8_9BACT|nr:hypothetical protein [Nitrospina watsonii]CAI2719484.1 conserved exported protein of unknown function [Nitrospina watsonii]